MDGVSGRLLNSCLDFLTKSSNYKDPENDVTQLRHSLVLRASLPSLLACSDVLRAFGDLWSSAEQVHGGGTGGGDPSFPLAQRIRFRLLEAMQSLQMRKLAAN